MSKKAIEKERGKNTQKKKTKEGTNSVRKNIIDKSLQRTQTQNFSMRYFQIKFTQKITNHI